jgi:predicted lipoprotein with Yx(FWY)xxD motif
MDAISSCDALCTVKRPVFRTSASERTTLLPSTIDVGALGALVRTDGQLQLTYRGWPLYYDSGDVTPGATEGHNERAWRAIDPIAFGSSEKLGSAD